jgi:hypothetical protein
MSCCSCAPGRAAMRVQPNRYVRLLPAGGVIRHPVSTGFRSLTLPGPA